MKKIFLKMNPKLGLGYRKFYLHLIYNQSFYYFLYSWANSIFGKNLDPGIWVEMLSANQIPEL